MSFYGNIYQDIKDHFFSRIRFKNAETTEETTFTAESADDIITFEAGDGLSFDTSGPDNQVILTHEKPWGQEAFSLFVSGPQASSYDISDGNDISFSFKSYDEFGHVINQESGNYSFNLNIDAEKGRREALNAELNKYSSLIDKASGKTLYQLLYEEIDAQVREKTLADFCIIGARDPNGILILDTRAKGKDGTV